MRKVIVAAVTVLLVGSLLFGQFDFSPIKNRISEFTLDNGLKFILLEDHSVPIASFVTYVNTGSSDERIGIYGISHFLEHLAFKGTSEIGTLDYEAEKKLFLQMDSLVDRIHAEKDSVQPDEQKIRELEEQLENLKTEAAAFVSKDTFDTILKRHGAVGLNAGTNTDATVYFFSLPSNKLELWAYLESSRFTDPVFREFYKERDVVAEERRVRTENQPVGTLIEEVLALAFKDHPYRVSVIGPMSNIQRWTRRHVREYFESNYTAGNMVIGVTGDVTPKELKKMATKYFSNIPAGRRNPPVYTEEPQQKGKKTITIYEESQPWLMIAHHCPAAGHPDYLKFEVLNYILTSGRSSRLYKKLVTDEKSALFIGSLAGFPGDKYPSLYLIYTLPNAGHTTDQLEEAVFQEIDNLKKEPVAKEELRSAKNRLKVSALRQMKSDQFFLMQLLGSEIQLGTWRKAFDLFDELETINPEDIQNLVRDYFTRNNRVIARIEKKSTDEEQEVSK